MSDSTIVLVTGANQGIGFEIARKLTSENKGYHVIMAGRRKDAVEAAAETLKKEGLSVEPLVLDLTKDESIAAAAKAVEAKHGHLDVLVNNAAILGPVGHRAGTREDWHSTFDANVFGTAAVTDAFTPLLEKSTKTKRVVFVTSVLGSLAVKCTPGPPTHNALQWRIYSTSKTALNMLATHYAIEYEKDPTWKFNACCPGYVATQMNGYNGTEPASAGAVNACRLATLGPDGETCTFSNKEGPLPW